MKEHPFKIDLCYIDDDELYILNNNKNNKIIYIHIIYT
jgi:hypothetical protein